jgi:histidinol-phosphate aminotransferase
VTSDADPVALDDAAPPGRIGRIARLGRNEWTVPYPEHALREMLARISGEDFVAIPELAGVYRQVAGFFGIPRENVLLCSGADAGIKAIFEVFVERGDEVVVVRPMFMRYHELCDLYGAQKVVVSYDASLELDLDALFAAIERGPRLVTLINPNNPTGTVLEGEVLLDVAAAARDAGTLLLVDEAYHWFCDVTVLPYAGEHENLVVLRSFSKAFGALAARLGAIVAHPDVLGRLRPVMSRPEINGIAAKILEYLLEHPEIMREHVEMTRASQPRLGAALAALGLTMLGSDAGSVLIELPEHVGPDEFVLAMKDEGYEVGGGMEWPLDRHVRAGLGPWEQMQGFARACERVLATRFA